MSFDVVPSVCPHDCQGTCALDVEIDGEGRLGRVRGSRRVPYTAGVLCAKVARYKERQEHPDRLTRPLLRRGPKGEQDFAPIAWDDALDLIAEKFLETERRAGAEAVWPYFYAGTMGLVMRDGINRLRRAKGYSEMDDTICVRLANVGWFAGHGVKWGVNAEECAESDYVVIWGGNPVSTQVNFMTHAQKARRAGARLIVVDPYRSPTAAIADDHLAPRPGTDGALACAMMSVILEEGLEDREELEARTDFDQGIEAHLRGRTPEWAAPITGLAPERIRAFARAYAKAQRPFLRLGLGFTRQRNGAAAMHAVSCLPVLVGAYEKRGGGALFGQASLYPLDKSLIEGTAWRDPATRVLDMSQIGPILVGEAEALRGGPPVEAILVQNTNPAAVAPETAKVLKGLGREDLFLAVHEQFMTETAAFADVVLPATTFLEHDDIYPAPGHSVLQIAEAALSPRGEARSNHDVICALAKRLGCDDPSFDATPMELIEATLAASGLPDARTIVDRGGHDLARSWDEQHFRKGYGHADGRFRFAPDWDEALGAGLGAPSAPLPARPDHVALCEEITRDKPFRLIAPPARNFLNSTFTETPGSMEREGAPEALFHPETLARLGLEPGAMVRLGNDRGEISIKCQSREGCHPDTITIESIFPNHCYINGLGVNSLIGADPGAPFGGAAFHDTAVWARAAGR